MTVLNAVPTPMEDPGTAGVPIKHAAQLPIHAPPVLTPARTPDEATDDTMAGKKLFELERPDDRARELAAKLTLEEQISLLAGADFWRTMPIPDRGIPSIKTTDGPNGARGEFFTNGTPAALFPCGISMAASWNVDLMEEIGRHLGEETKARGANVLLAPTVCMHRSPLGGRNFESYSEDPYLTGKLAASYIRGVQSKGIAATIKHFVANEQETERQAYDAIIAERPLREIYLKPFEIAVRDASPWALMTSYNLLNGVHADEHLHTIKDILRGEWQYDGTLLSDWTGTYATAPSIKAGCDIEMPGPTKWRKLPQVLEALDKGELTKEDIEYAAGNVLYLVDRTKGLNGPPETPEQSNENAETNQLIRQAGIEGLTLLKNDGNILPIKHARKIAVIGPNAKRAIVGGGGSAGLNPYYTVNPFDGIRSRTDAELIFAQGCDSSKWLPLASPYCTTADGQSGVTLEYYHGDRFKGEPAVVQHKAGTDLWLWDSAPKEVLPAYSFKVKTTITPSATGKHTFSFASVGPGRVFLSGELFIDNWDWTEEGEAMFSASSDFLKSIHLEANKPVELLVESTNEVRPASKVSFLGRSHDYGGCRIGYQEEAQIDLISEAVSAAKAADVAILVVGLDAEWESEGYDRQTMDLPKDTDKLIEAVLAANPRSVIVNQSGTPVTMPWADRAPAILQAWYQGQEAGNALADVLFGVQSPSGKLPTTFPRRLEDNPAFHNWPCENLKTVYGEGVYIGYRHYERAKIEPLFAFGHGLSYTRFEYGAPELSGSVLAEDGSITVSVPVTNAGAMAAHEIVQVYVRDVKSALPRPEKELQAFRKVWLEPGETKRVDLRLDKYSVGYFDTSLGQTGAWIAEEGAFEVVIGASSVDVRQTVSFEVKESFQWIF